MEELSCKSCGGILDENLTCQFCGMRYKSNDPSQVTNNNSTNNTYNITLNIGAGADTANLSGLLGSLQNQPQQEEEQPAVAEEAPADDAPTAEVPEEPEAPAEPEKPLSHYERHPYLTRLASSAGLLYAICIIGCPICLYLGFKNEDTKLMLIGIAAGILTAIISTFWKEK